MKSFGFSGDVFLKGIMSWYEERKKIKNPNWYSLLLLNIMGQNKILLVFSPNLDSFIDFKEYYLSGSVPRNVVTF